MKNKNTYSHLTAKDRDKISFPVKILLNNQLLKGKILDFGCGKGSDVKFLKDKGYDITGFDPFYFPKKKNDQYDTIICIYVLNVLQKTEQADVLIQISRLLKPGGRAFFAVRRDIKYEGFRTHKIYGKKTFQCNVVLNNKSIYKSKSLEIYEYQHYNYATDNIETKCPFCKIEKDELIIAESATAFAIYDNYPVTKGHVLVIPKKHKANYFELSFNEQIALFYLVNKVKEILQEKYNPQGFNVGININEAAGQTIPHVHVHIIPRYKGDVANPRGGVRGVIPKKQNY